MAVIRRDKHPDITHPSGHVNKEIVFKNYEDKIVVTIYPDMSNVKLTQKQKAEQTKFSKAVAFAKGVVSDPEKKKVYAEQAKEGQTAYAAAIAVFMKG